MAADAGREDNELVARAARIMLERTARTVGVEFFMALARGVAETLGTRYGLVGELVDPVTQRVRTLAVWNGDGFGDNFEYLLAGTPCESVLTGEACHHPRDVAKRFPADTMLTELGIESYLGLPITGRHARPLGLVVALHDQVTAPVPELTGVLALFADRAAAELERTRFEAELGRSEARYRQIVSSCSEGVWMIDARGITTFVNAQLAAMLGYAEAEMLGQPLSAFLDPRGRGTAEAHLARRAGSVAEHHEFQFRHKRGHDVWTLMAANPLYDDRGTYAGALALATDMTERRGLEAAAQRAQKLESLGVLAGGVAHDFNNLLVGILGNADVALREASPPRAALEDIRSAALRASELTHQLLAFAGKGTFVMELVDLNAIIADMGRLLSTAISKKTLLRFMPASSTALVEADAGQLSQVVMNLITNASEALGDETGIVTVTTGTLHADREHLRRTFFDESLAPGDYVFLEVSDTGCGMDADTLTRIFDPFFTTKFTGRGLGLAALRGVLRGHRGAISVASEVGKGTTFKVLLPSAEPARTAAAVSAQAVVAPMTGRVILVADDERLIRTVVGHLLGAEGCTVIEAVDGLDALEKYRARADEIDLVLLDLTMPGLSGAQVFQALRGMRPDVRVLLTSGYAEGDVESRLGGRPDGFLPKPWTADALVAAVRAALLRE